MLFFVQIACRGKTASIYTAENAQMSKKAFSVRGRNFYKEQWVVASNLIYPRLHQCIGMLCEQNEVATISRSISFFRVSVA